ncbi:MAG TPA: alpha/beta hydrolase [Candidatus Limnocylindrales bacterium]|jgi:pimeloyl-ACP methyl ester carboxylesterase|nr:alpha/beta hydrolase [Candidatus Limnocylindrales bacterium]
MILDTEEQVIIRVHGPSDGPTLVYLPGLHGDWTLIASFRKALGQRVRFIETAYPDTLSWSLDDHAAAVEAALHQHGISAGWILAESFGSQVTWPLVRRQQFNIEGIILAGGFVRHPARWAAKVSGRWLASMPLAVIKTMLNGYARVAPWRFRRDPETASSIYDYINHLTERRRQALIHRLNLVAKSDFCLTATHMDVPLFALTGFWDPIVPWFFVRDWLRKKCPTLRQWKLLYRADHNVLGTASTLAAQTVLHWMQVTSPKPVPSPNYNPSHKW